MVLSSELEDVFGSMMVGRVRLFNTYNSVLFLACRIRESS